MACDPNETVTRICDLRDIEHKLIRAKASPRALMAVHAETCAALTELLTDHGAKLGLDSATVSRASEPKHK
jgi:hypothetical protein